MTRAKKLKENDNFLELLKKGVKEIVEGAKTTNRDKNAAIANGAKLLQIEHKINPNEPDSFFGDNG